MSYRVDIDPAAAKELGALSGHVRAQALQMFRRSRQIPTRTAQKNCAASPAPTASGLQAAGALCTRLMMISRSSLFCAFASKKILTTTRLGSPFGKRCHTEPEFT